MNDRAWASAPPGSGRPARSHSSNTWTWASTTSMVWLLCGVFDLDRRFSTKACSASRVSGMLFHLELGLGLGIECVGQRGIETGVEQPLAGRDRRRGELRQLVTQPCHLVVERFGRHDARDQAQLV